MLETNRFLTTFPKDNKTKASIINLVLAFFILYDILVINNL